MQSKAAVLCLVLPLFVPVAMAEDGWPREIETAKGVVTIYQPQVDLFDGDAIGVRAAVSVLPPDSDTGPVFGAVWINGRLEVDRDSRVVALRDVTVPNVRFPDVSEEDRDALVRLLEREIPNWDLSMALDRLIAELDNGSEDFSTPGLKHDPPEIIHSNEPAILIVIDGDPIVQEIEEIQSAKLKRVVNTPFLIALDVTDNTYYLSAGGGMWYWARDPLGPWEIANRVPTHVAALDTSSPDDIDNSESPPKIIVATEPTELIVSAGPPSWAPVEGVDLLYMDNTDSDVFLDIVSQHYYVVLNGRWFRGTALDGVFHWIHVPNDELPEGFSGIPEDSVNGNVLPHVAGTVQAREAALDNAIPQTAAIDRKAADLTLEYDGKPQFEAVEDVPGVEYAVNTPSSVFHVSNLYYACHQGAWYKASSASGPWTVTDTVPQAIYDIPASNPHHNVTYVHVYHSTPEVVYVGYTPGYTSSYYSHGCVVWSTGWSYRPWYGSYYYPRPAPWGFRVSYHPYYGWGVGVTWSNGPFSISIGGRGSGYRYGGAWFGVGGYRPYARPYVGVGFHKTTININNPTIGRGGNRPGGVGGTRPGTRPSAGTKDRPRGNNIYDRPQNRDRNVARPATSDRQRPNVAGDRSNNVMTDRDGNVFRRDQSGQWQQRDGGQWKDARNLDKSNRPGAGASGERPGSGSGNRPSARPSTPAARPSTGSSSSRPNTPSYGRPSGGGATRPQLERNHNARQRGNQRAGGYQRSQGASRGGGRRR